MSKIVQAVNAIISNPDLITEVKMGSWDKEYYFRYKNKYVWSIYEGDDGTYGLMYYPDGQDIQYLASIPQEYWHDQNIATVIYRSNEIGTKEAVSSFKELYLIVREKVYGMDDILSDIIGDEAF